MIFLHELLAVSNSIATVVPFTLVLYDYGTDTCRSSCDPETDRID